MRSEVLYDRNYSWKIKWRGTFQKWRGYVPEAVGWKKLGDGVEGRGGSGREVNLRQNPHFHISALLNYICENYDEIECELNGDEYKEPKKHNRNLALTATWK